MKSEAADRFQVLRWTAPMASAAIVFLASGQLEPVQRSVATIFMLTIGLWIGQALPLAITALLSTALLV